MKSSLIQCPDGGGAIVSFNVKLYIMDCIKMVVAMNKETSILIQTDVPVVA